MGTNQIVNDDNYTNNMEFECCPECGHGLNKSLNGTFFSGPIKTLI